MTQLWDTFQRHPFVLVTIGLLIAVILGGSFSAWMSRKSTEDA